MTEQFQIVLIDTEDDILVQGISFLEQELDCIVTTIHHSDTAIQLLTERSYHAIVSRVGIPNIEGIKILQSLRGRGRSNSLPNLY